MTEERGLTWSKKWHVIDPDKRSSPNSRYDIARCGAYLYRNDDPRYPESLKAVRDGARKSTGLCKLCAKSISVNTTTVELPQLTADEYHEARWEVPLYNPYTNEVGDRLMYRGEVWIARISGKIAVTGVPSKLDTADDARRFAAALLAAADWLDKQRSTAS